VGGRGERKSEGHRGEGEKKSMKKKSERGGREREKE